MKSKKEIQETIAKNRGTDFVLPMSWDVMFEQMFISKEAMPLLEHIIAVFGNIDINDVKGKVRLLPNELKQTSAKDMSYNYVDKQEEQVAIISRMFMTTSSLELDKESDKLMSKKDTEKLVSRAKELSSDGEYVKLFDKEENYKELIRNTELAAAHEDGIKQGIARGLKEKALEMAKKCLGKEMNIETVSKLTGLSIEEIENLK